MPPDGSVNVVISNCVINLSGDKDRVLAEAFRALKPGGRLAISDIIVRWPIPAEIRTSMELWAGWVAGALEEQENRAKLAHAGFQDITIDPTCVYSAADALEFLAGDGLDAPAISDRVDGRFMSGFIRVRKPA